MATASEAIERVAEAMDLLPTTVFRAARALREADSNLWPQGSQGRGRAAHVKPAHLVNILLALSGAGPMTTAPEIVRIYRGMTFPDNQRLSNTGRTAHIFFLHGSMSAEPINMVVSGKGILGSDRGLGGDLENLIQLFAGLNGAVAREVLRDSELTIELVTGRFPRALIGYYDRASGMSRRTGRYLIHYLPPQITHYLPRYSTVVTPPTIVGGERLMRVFCGWLEVLADLLSDTVTNRSSNSPLSSPAVAPASATPGIENAGSPAREPAPTRDQDRVTDLASEHPEYGREREFSQALSEHGPGPSQFNEGIQYHDPPSPGFNSATSTSTRAVGPIRRY